MIYRYFERWHSCMLHECFRSKLGEAVPSYFVPPLGGLAEWRRRTRSHSAWQDDKEATSRHPSTTYHDLRCQVLVDTSFLQVVSCILTWHFADFSWRPLCPRPWAAGHEQWERSAIAPSLVMSTTRKLPLSAQSFAKSWRETKKSGALLVSLSTESQKLAQVDDCARLWELLLLLRRRRQDLLRFSKKRENMHRKNMSVVCMHAYAIWCMKNMNQNRENRKYISTIYHIPYMKIILKHLIHKYITQN